MFDTDSDKKPSIFQLKRKYKRLFLIQFKKYDILFRLLTWGEIKIIRSLDNIESLVLKEDLYDSIWDECVLEHDIPDMDNVNAGIIPSVIRCIIYMSTITDLNQFINKLEEQRKTTLQLENQIELLLSKAFGYKTAEIDDMITSEIFDNLAKAEIVISGKNMPELPITFEDKKDKKSQHNQSAPPKNVHNDFKRRESKESVQYELEESNLGDYESDNGSNYYVNTAAMNRALKAEGF